MEFVNKLLSKVFGNKSDKDIKAIMPLVEEIKAEYAKLSSLSNDELRDKSKALQGKIAEYIRPQEEEMKQLKEKANLPSTTVEEKDQLFNQIDELSKKADAKLEEILLQVLPEAFAIVKDTARRFTENEIVEVKANDFDRELATTRDHIEIDGDKALFHNSWDAAGTEVIWNMIHYDVQLIGGVALHQGKIAEMATGEGKTLVATLPVFLNALAKKGVHLVTVNDYLAKRDSEWNAPIFQFHGLSVDCIDNYPSHSPERKKAYEADITYGTNNEFGFDYLRDNMARSIDDLVQKKHHFAIVDEVDSVLIDDARTPLIISGATKQKIEQEYHTYKTPVEQLFNMQKKLVTGLLADAKKLIEAENKEDGGMALLRAHRGLPKNKALIKFLSTTGIKALLQKTENYYLQENGKQMPKVDQELYFVIDEKSNSIELTQKGIDAISSYANGDSEFFMIPDIGGRIADIEKMEASDEEKVNMRSQLMTEYTQKASRIHTIQQLLKAYALFEKDVEYVVMNNKVMIVDEQTGRIMDGRRFSDGLHQALEAKEAVKIEAPSQTHATITLQNYFRMYHKLAGMTGTAETEAGELWEIYKLDVVVIPTNRPIQRDDREDKVYKTAREKYNAIIEEIVEIQKAGRPVLVGTTSVEISELLSRMLKMRGLNHQVLNAKMHEKESMVVAEAGKKAAVTIATNMAGRGTDIKLSDEIKAAGGLAIIGTERHESRRVDRQLRGRAGRQGDPGSSQFFVSLEDNLMRLFSSDRIAAIMDRMGLKEGEVIQHSMITKSIERAQKKVEENNFGIRKRLLEYDDAMNKQREVIYKRRRNALYGDRIAIDIADMIYDLCASIVQSNYGTKNFDGLNMDCLEYLGLVNHPFTEEKFSQSKEQDLVNELYQKATQNINARKEFIQNTTRPVIKNIYENEENKFENIVIPFTDGKKMLQLPVNLTEAYESEGKAVVKTFEKSLTLAIIDDCWRDHLKSMDDLKTSVQNASYEQKDPLLIYKFESMELFKGMLNKINQEAVSFFSKASIPQQQGNPNGAPVAPPRVAVAPGRPVQQPNEIGGNAPQNLQANKPQVGGGASSNAKPQAKQPVVAEAKVGRNDLCPCGSGKKYKKCHGA